MASQERGNSKTYDTYIYEDFNERDLNKARKRADEIADELTKFGFAHIDIAISSLPRNDKTGKRPEGFEITVIGSGHADSVSRWLSNDEFAELEALENPEEPELEVPDPNAPVVVLLQG